MNRIHHSSRGDNNPKSSNNEGVLTNQEFVWHLKKRLEETFDTQVDQLKEFCNQPVTNRYSLYFEGAFIMIRYEELTPESSMLHCHIICRCMHRNLMLGVKWMEANLNEGVLRVDQPDSKNDPLGDIILLGTQVVHHSDHPGLNVYLDYIKNRLSRLKFSLDQWFPQVMPGFLKGIMLTDLPAIGCDFVAKIYYLKEYLNEKVKEIPSECHDLDEFIYFSYISWKDWEKALNYIEKEMPDHVLGVNRIERGNRNVFRRVRCLLGLGKVDEAERCLNDLEDCFDDDQSTFMCQELKMRVLFEGRKFEELLNFADSPEIVESPRVDFWKSRVAIQLNDVGAAIDHCLAYEKQCGFDLLLRHKITHRFPREFKENEEYWQSISNFDLREYQIIDEEKDRP